MFCSSFSNYCFVGSLHVRVFSRLEGCGTHFEHRQYLQVAQWAICQCDMLTFFDLFLNTSNHNCIIIEDVPWMPLTLSFVFGMLEYKAILEMLSLLTYHRLGYSLLLDRPGDLCCKTWHWHSPLHPCQAHCAQNKGKTVLYYICLGCKAFPYSKGIYLTNLALTVGFLEGLSKEVSRS